MADRVRVGVVGVGKWGTHHVRVFHSLPDAALVGVYDLNPERSEAVAARFQTRAFPTLEALLAEVEAVSCAVSTPAHFEVGRQILSAGVHLLLEKPMAQDLEGAKELKRLAGDRGVVLQIGHIERFNPAILAAQPLIHRPLFIEAHRLSPFRPRSLEVDVILDLMIHDLDLILAWVRSRPLRVEAVGVPVLSERVDIANARIEFENGAVANVTASRVSATRLRKIRIFQPDAYLSIDYVDRTVAHYRKVNGAIAREMPKVQRDLEPLKLELESFLRAVRGEAPPAVSAEEGYRALSLALEVRRALFQRMARFPDLGGKEPRPSPFAHKKRPSA